MILLSLFNTSVGEIYVKFTAGVVDPSTSGRFTTGVYVTYCGKFTIGKFAAGVTNTQVVNLRPMSLTLVVNLEFRIPSRI
jgi:hypothetical protein